MHARTFPKRLSELEPESVAFVEPDRLLSVSSAFQGPGSEKAAVRQRHPGPGSVPAAPTPCAARAEQVTIWNEVRCVVTLVYPRSQKHYYLSTPLLFVDRSPVNELGTWTEHHL